MLFDLRGKGRRNTVRVIYLALALLMGGGLVLFGVGGNVSGGLLNAFDSNGASTDNTFEKRVAKLEARVKRNPTDAPAWANLARARSQEAAVGDNYDQNTSAYTPKGRAKLREAATAWERYLALEPPKPNADIANVMVQAYGPAGLNELDKAVGAMEIVVDRRRPETAALYAQLAQLAYLAGQNRKGDLSAKKALQLAPKDQKAQLKQTLDSFKNEAIKQALQQAQSTPPPATATP
jgi:cytochrome c-type biogenesis protein CcmH/NrfG